MLCIRGLREGTEGQGALHTFVTHTWGQESLSNPVVSLGLGGADAPDLPRGSEGGSGPWLLFSGRWEALGSALGRAEQGSVLAAAPGFTLSSSWAPLAVPSSFPIPAPLHVPLALSWWILLQEAAVNCSADPWL